MMMMTTNTPSQATPHHVVIVGGGFAGLNCAQRLSNQPNVKVTLIDKRNFHLFQPLLYQVATGSLAASEIASPLRYVLRDAKNVSVHLGEVTDFDLENKQVLLADGHLAFDELVVATGSHHHYFGKDEWSSVAPGLKTLEDALAMRRKILMAFEAAERETDPVKRAAWLTFIVVGGGPTGVELAGSIADLARETLKGQFRSCALKETRIIIAEGSPRALPVFSENLSAKANDALKKLNIELKTQSLVVDVTHQSASIKSMATNEVETIATHTILWAAGVMASGLGKKIAEKTGAEIDRMGRVVVSEDLSIPNHPSIYVAGDLANFAHTEGNQPLPGVAPVAMQGGLHVAESILAKLNTYKTNKFNYIDKGSMAIIGNNKAVARVGSAEFSGFIAWAMWLLIHVTFLVEFDNKIVVIFNWATNYLTRKRACRLITGDVDTPLLDNDASN
jgi:NADH dehydrogenase